MSREDLLEEKTKLETRLKAAITRGDKNSEKVIDQKIQCLQKSLDAVERNLLQKAFTSQLPPRRICAL